MDLHRLTATALAALIRKAEVSAVEVTQAALSRISATRPASA